MILGASTAAHTRNCEAAQACRTNQTHHFAVQNNPIFVHVVGTRARTFNDAEALSFSLSGVGIRFGGDVERPGI